MNPKRAALLLCAAALALPASARAAGTLLVLGPHGHLQRVWDRYLPAAQPMPAPSAAAAALRATTPTGPTVSRALLTLAQAGAISAVQEASDVATYSAARHTLTHLSGTRRAELGAVIANLQSLAAGGVLTADRLPAAMLTLEQNRRWWSTAPLLAADARVGFPGSHLVWEYYPGQGIQIQWLGTFGQANAYWSAHRYTALGELLDEALPLASARGGGLTWEYQFRFDGGPPPWTSALSQGTAIQVLARAAGALGDDSLLADAHRALAIFTVPPPLGVAVPTPSGTTYVEYTYAPSDRILNGFIQSLIGLYDDALLSGDPLAVALFQAGDTEARAEVPQYNTGAWSLYDQYGESDLSYHKLLTTFLSNLCTRVSAAALAPPAAPALATAGPPAEPAPVPSPTAQLTGGTAPPAPATLGDPTADAVYCTTAQAFSADLKASPVLALLPTRLTGGRAGTIRFTLSKIATVTLSVRRGGVLVYRRQALLGHGARAFGWTPPRAGGRFAVTVAATDLAGNTGRGVGTVDVTPRRRGGARVSRAAPAP